MDHPFKVGDWVELRDPQNVDWLPVQLKLFPARVDKVFDNNSLVEIQCDGCNQRWHYTNLKLVEPKPAIKEWKVGWTVQNTSSNAVHVVSVVDSQSYGLVSKTNQMFWYLEKTRAHRTLLKNNDPFPAYVVIEKKEVTPPVELSCVKTIPAQKERRVIQPGRLYSDCQLSVQSCEDAIIYMTITHPSMRGWWLNKETLRKTAQAFNTLADILEENEGG